MSDVGRIETETRNTNDDGTGAEISAESAVHEIFPPDGGLKSAHVALESSLATRRDSHSHLFSRPKIATSHVSARATSLSVFTWIAGPNWICP